MTKLVWLSDLHFSASERPFGIDTKASLLSAFAQVEQNAPDAEGCVISGDLVNRATDENYAALAELLCAFDHPVFPMVGNHDVRRNVRNHFSLPASTMDDFIQYSVEFDDCTILCLDTQDQGADHGAFCSRRADWLNAVLNAQPKKPTIVFAHHPPAELGLPMQDQDRLKDGDRLIFALTAAPQVVYLCCGHVHRTLSGVAQGVPFSTIRSSLYQAPPPLPDWTWKDFAPAKETAQFAILDVAQDFVCVHFHDISALD